MIVETVKMEKLTGRVRYNLTLPVRLKIRRRIALQKVDNQHPCYIGEDYTNDKGNPLLNLILNQFMSPSLQTLIESRGLFSLYIQYQPQMETKYGNN